MTIEPCTGCGYGSIVNRKHWLCDGCNFKRLHDGKTKQEVYVERKREKDDKSNKSKQVFKSSKPRASSKGDIRTLIKKYSIKNVSKSNSYRCSDGSKITQPEINRRYADTCQRIEQERDPVCQGTGRTDLPLSFSHTISRKRCKEIGRTELIWAERNIEIEGYTPPGSFSEGAHNIWESGNLEKKRTLLNFTRKLEYIKENDYEQYVKFIR